MKRFMLLALAVAALQTTSRADWFDELIEAKEAAAEQPVVKKAPPLPDFGGGDFTFCAWIAPQGDGTVFAKTAPRDKWGEGGKSLFIAGGQLNYDIGWEGCVKGRARLSNKDWHHVALTGGAPQRLYVNGKLDAEGDLEKTPDREGFVLMLGFTARDFPDKPYFEGGLDDVRIYNRRLSDQEIKSLFESKNPADGPTNGLVAWWPFDGHAQGTTPYKRPALSEKRIGYQASRFGERDNQNKAAWLSDKQYFTIPTETDDRLAFWQELRRKFPDDASLEEMAREREEVLGLDWQAATYPELAKRYAAAVKAPASLARAIKERAAGVKSVADLRPVRELYLEARRNETYLKLEADVRLGEVRELLRQNDDRPNAKKLLAAIDALETRTAQWPKQTPSAAAVAQWKTEAAALRRRALLDENPLLDFDKLVFIKRFTYHSSHFYTDFIDGVGNFGGNLCILEMKTGKATDLLPEMKEGIFGRFDLNFDAKKIVFDWKKAPREGFRIYEIDIDPVKGVRLGGPRALTQPPADEAARIKKYDNSFLGGTARMYYHQTDDMHPCYLPDGGIVFTSSRCEYGTLCDSPDALATAILYRIDGDGGNLQQLTNSAVSEFSPSIMEDGRILYTRWEYVDKGQLGIKCLWAMRPDGSGTVEIYGNDIQFPPTMMHGRQIPGESNLFVMLGTPHYPQSGIGTVIRVDTTRNIRTLAPMTYITPHVDIQQEGGWNHRVNGKWTRHQNGPLYMDPFPLSASWYLVAHNPDKLWKDPKAYGLYLIGESGAHELIHDDPDISCWQPTPLRPRKRPPVLPSMRDPGLAEKNMATVMVQDVYRGMEGIQRGEVKYLRVMEQLPRPWDARRFWQPRGGGHTALVSRGTALAAKAMWGVVPVLEDGSAHFYVPADRNVYLQALDENYMELQRERTYINYRPGEKRSCVGCHEMPKDAPPAAKAMALAMRLPPVMPGPQPGDNTGQQVIHYPTYVQPILDKHCVECHGAEQPAGKLDLTDAMTQRFNRSYENIMRRGLVKTYAEASDWGGSPYVPPKTIGSHASRFITSIRGGKGHEELKLPQADFVRLATWVDASGVYYGSYWGRRLLEYKDHPNFRPAPTFAEAISVTCPTPIEKR